MTRAQGLSDFAAGLGETLKIDADNDRVGINSTAPTEALDVVGNVKVSGSITGASFTGIDVTSLKDTAGGSVKVQANGSGAVVTGVLTATSFVGSGANLTGVISGVELKQGGSSVGTSITAINFSGATVSAPTAGLSTVTIAQTLTLGVRTGAAVTFGLTGSSFNVVNRSGSNVPISI